MSTRYSGLARRSFIIGSRLWPPAMMRASEPCSCSACSTPSTLVARSYPNGAGVCTRAPFASAGRQALTRLPDVLALLVLGGSVGPDDRRSGQVLRALLAALGIQPPCREAAALDVAQHRARRGGRGDRG